MLRKGAFVGSWPLSNSQRTTSHTWLLAELLRTVKYRHLGLELPNAGLGVRTVPDSGLQRCILPLKDPFYYDIPVAIPRIVSTSRALFPCRFKEQIDLDLGDLGRRQISSRTSRRPSQ
jgi:hypothetical protein